MSKNKVLIVEDEEDVLDLVKIHLQREHFQTLTSKSADEALEIVAQTPPDLIILDVQMPIMDGMEVFERLRKEETTKSIPVIMVTGIREKVGIDFDPKDMEKLYGEKPHGYVEKPVVPRELVKKVKKYL